MPVTLQITEAQADRLARLAAEAGSTPEAMLSYVLEDGFDFTEATIRKINAAITEADAGGEMIPHEEAMARLHAVIEAHAAEKAA